MRKAQKYRELRAEAVADVSLIDLTAGGGDWDNRPSGIHCLEEADEQNMAIIFAGPAGETFNWKLWGCVNKQCPIEYLADGTGAIGTQTIVKLPDGTTPSAARLWCDTIVITNDRGIRPADSTDSGGNNEVAKLKVKNAGYRYFYLEITGGDNVSAWYMLYKDFENYDN